MSESASVVGISLSGGGLRSAAFSLGALQALQRRRGLLRGADSARYLAAVSGGSYIAGAYTLVNCSDRIAPPNGTAGVPPQEPFAPGSPEAEHLRRHCRYLVEDGGIRTSLWLATLAAFNFLAIASLIAWAGVMLADVGWVASWVEPSEVDSRGGIVWLEWVLAASAFVLLAIGLARIYRSQGELTWPRRLARVGGFLLLLGLAPALAARVTDTPGLQNPVWFGSHWWWVLCALGAVLAGTVLAHFLARRSKSPGSGWSFAQRVGVSLLTLRLVQLLFLLAAAWTIGVFFPLVKHHHLLFLVFFFGVLVAPLLLQPLIDRASPHNAYRDALMRCFGVYRRNAEDVEPVPNVDHVRLSALGPQPGAQAFPELLVCAAANVSDLGATPAGSNVLSIVFSPSEIAVPAVPQASVPTSAFERFLRPAHIRGEWCPAVTLASAIAMTGAAVSPAMGRKTRNNLRALFTALNIRLGVWIPNLLATTPAVPGLDAAQNAIFTTLTQIRNGETDDAEVRVKVGLDELVRELFGYHSKAAPLLYVSDGGHYENLALTELLRKGCTEVWCVDASGDRPGNARALAEALLLASAELGVEIDLNLERFALDESAPPGSRWVQFTHATGTVAYPDGTQGKIVVVKLGLTSRSPDALLEYQRTDPVFPHHPTLNQLFRAERFDAYRALGWASMNEALDEVETFDALELEAGVAADV